MNDKAKNIILTKEQLEIISFNKNLVVIADPGSGKTTTLAHKIATILPELMEHQGVISISYTNKASDELELKVTKLTKDTKKSFFGTIDKFSISEIIIPFSKLLYNIKTENNKNFFQIKKAVDEYEYLKELNDEELFINLIDLIQKGFIILDYVSKFALYILDISSECEKYIKARYKHVLIDEYQDCDEYKHQIFLKLINIGLTGTAVGDPNQTIFSYDGSSSEHLIKLANQKLFEVKYLDINHRCHESITNYALKFINPKGNYKIAEDKRIYGFKINGAEEKNAEWIDHNISYVMDKIGTEKLSDIAVLCTNNRTAKIMYEKLQLNSVLIVDTPIDKSTNVADILAKNILIYILGNHNIYIDSLFQELNINKRNKVISQVQELKKHYKEYNKLDKPKFLDLIKKIVKSEFDDKNIVATINSEDNLETYKKTNNKLRVMTIHKSKGLEFKAVIIVDLHEWILPKKIPKNGTTSYINVNECKNLHYVSVTRAEELVVFLFNNKRHNNAYELKQGVLTEFIKERPDLIEYRNIKCQFK